MNGEQGQQDTLRDEFEQLGENLKALIQGAWESEQRKQVSQEVERGLNEVGASISNAAAELAQEPAARKLREEVDQLAERVRSGELAEKARQEIVDVLQQVNNRLTKLVGDLETGREQSEDAGQPHEG